MSRRRRERRSASPPRFDPFLAEFSPQYVSAGLVTADAALSNLSVAYRCVALRSELLASVPLRLYRRLSDGAREPATDHPLYRLLHDAPNSDQTAFEAREMWTRALDLDGNAYARVEADGTGRIIALWPAPRGAVMVERLAGGRLRYRFSVPGQPVRVLLQEEVLHIRAAGTDGVMGVSPLRAARGALGLAMDQIATTGALVQNSLKPSVVASHPGKLSQKAKDNIREGIERDNAGPQNAGRPMVLEEGLKIERISFSPVDAQLLEQRRLSNADVARIFACPPSSVGIQGDTPFATAEQESRHLVAHALAPLAARIEAAMQRCLLTEAERAVYFIEHDLDGLLRGELGARYTAYATGRQWGWLSPNDVRRLENLPPIAAGDEYLRPLNMAALGSPAPGRVPPGAPPAEE